MTTPDTARREAYALPGETGDLPATIDAILQQAVHEDDYPKGAHRFFQDCDPYGDRENAVTRIMGAVLAEASRAADAILAKEQQALAEAIRKRPYVLRNEVGTLGGRVVIEFEHDDQMNAILALLTTGARP